jgi:hypothetical protein
MQCLFTPNTQTTQFSAQHNADTTHASLRPRYTSQWGFVVRVGQPRKKRSKYIYQGTTTQSMADQGWNQVGSSRQATARDTQSTRFSQDNTRNQQAGGPRSYGVSLLSASLLSTSPPTSLRCLRIVEAATQTTHDCTPTPQRHNAITINTTLETTRKQTAPITTRRTTHTHDVNSKTRATPLRAQ